MNRQPSLTSTVGDPKARNSSSSEVRLQGAWLVLARIGWVAVSVMAVGLFVASIPSYFAYLHVPATSSFLSPQLTAGDALGRGRCHAEHHARQRPGKHGGNGASTLHRYGSGVGELGTVGRGSGMDTMDLARPGGNFIGSRLDRFFSITRMVRQKRSESELNALPARGCRIFSLL